MDPIQFSGLVLCCTVLPRERIQRTSTLRQVPDYRAGQTARTHPSPSFLPTIQSPRSQPRPREQNTRQVRVQVQHNAEDAAHKIARRRRSKKCTKPPSVRLGPRPRCRIPILKTPALPHPSACRPRPTSSSGRPLRGGIKVSYTRLAGGVPLHGRREWLGPNRSG